MHRNSQFMERLFTLLMTGAYGLVMVLMFASHYLGWNPGERSLLSLVTPWIQYTILIGGIFLLGMFVIQLITLRSGGGDGHHHSHEHHEHDHAHEHHHHDHHDHHDHDLKHGEDCKHEGCGHDHHHHNHKHEHKHDHAHHGHDCCDHGHDHGWNPIRYIPLLVPLILIVMGLPDTKMIENFEKHRIQEALQRERQVIVPEQFHWMAFGAISAPNEVFPQAAFSTLFAYGVQSIIDEMDDDAKDVTPIVTDLAQLENVAKNPALIPQYEQYRKVQLEGMFNMEDVNGGFTYFRIVRLRMACCLSDTRPAMILCRTKKPINPSLLDKNRTGTKWVKAQGRLKFAPGPEGKMVPYFKVVSVEPAPTPPFPYLS
jgi:hypothetical protein